MTLGAEPKKMMILGGLLLVAVVVFIVNSSSSGEDSGYKPPTSRSGTTAPVAKAPGIAAPLDTPSSAPRSSRAAEREFRPAVRPKRGEARPDPTSIDPTLRLDLLAKLQQVNVEGTHRSIFDFGQAPPPEATKPPVAIAKGPKAPNPLTPDKPATPVAATPPAAPQAPPVPLKFFGYTAPSNQPSKRAFFMEGEDIHVVREGEIVKNRYKIVRIGVNSVVVEDIQFKSQQTLPLEEQTT
jgi:hypothetical protein